MKRREETARENIIEGHIAGRFWGFSALASAGVNRLTL